MALKSSYRTAGGYMRSISIQVIMCEDVYVRDLYECPSEEEDYVSEICLNVSVMMLMRIL